MKTILFKPALLLCFILAPILTVAGNGVQNGRYTKEKTIKKEFKVNPDALLTVDNSYGNLTLTSWNEDRIVIEVLIKTSGNNEDRVKEKLDELNVDFQSSASSVSAKTIFRNTNSGWNWGWGKNSNVSMQINYTIKLPVKNNVNLSNDYGNIILDRIDGHARISCDYGRLEIGELRGRSNQLSFDYTSKSSFGFINSAKISADYSGFTVEKAGDLDISADYTNMNIHQMENLLYSSDYGSLEVDEAHNVKGRGDYINVKLGTVHGYIDIAADYGSLDIKNLSENAGNVTLDTDYTGIKIGYSGQYFFDFEITTSYADVRGTDDFEINISRERSQERYYKGYHGQENSGNTIQINSDYGGVSFQRNP